MSDNNVMSILRRQISEAIEMAKDKEYLPLSHKLSTLQNILGIDSNPPNLNGFCAFAEKVVGWIPLNPNDIDRVRALVSAYHLPGYDYVDPSISSLEEPHPKSKEYLKQRKGLQSGNSSLLPTKEGMFALFDSVCQRNSQLILLLGKRGSGKTFALNFFLATAHRALAENKILWFRTDIAKLWVYEKKYLNVLQYTILHTIYVALKYSCQDPNLFGMKDYGKDFVDYLNDLVDDNKEYIEELLPVWAYIVSAYKAVQRQAREQEREEQKPVLDFLREGHIILERYGNAVVENLFKEMMTYLRRCNNEGDKKLRIVIIFDGVDNIRVDAEPQRYVSFIEQIDRIVSNVPLKIADKFIFVSRPETFVDMSNMKTSMINGRVTPMRFMLDCDFIPELLIKKSNAIKRPVEYFQLKAEVYIGQKFIDTSKSNDFLGSIEYLLKLFGSATRNIDLN